MVFSLSGYLYGKRQPSDLVIARVLKTYNLVILDIFLSIAESNFKPFIPSPVHLIFTGYISYLFLTRKYPIQIAINFTFQD